MSSVLNIYYYYIYSANEYNLIPIEHVHKRINLALNNYIHHCAFNVVAVAILPKLVDVDILNDWCNIHCIGVKKILMGNLPLIKSKCILFSDLSDSMLFKLTYCD